MPDIQAAEFRSAFVSHTESYAFAMCIAAYYSLCYPESATHRQPLVGAEQVAGANPALLRRAVRALPVAQGLRPLLGAHPGVAHDLGQRRLGEPDIAAGCIEAAGQPVQRGDGAAGLGGVAVLAGTGPGEEGQRQIFRDEVGRRLDLSRWDAGGLLHVRRCPGTAALCQ